MSKLTLNHRFTPDNLKDINGQIEAVLDAKELDNELLKQLIIKRDVVVTNHLKSLERDNEKVFAEHEIIVNNTLSTIVESQLKESLTQLSGLIRGKKIVNKYK
ncbi:MULTISPECIES: hypothetical protein [Aliiglaciecola]|uniref:hypothetical protein n=1 Tax=Aliiglaciecola TaxID=1406885 RepID=UPI001C097189|nr:MULTISPECIES: hypothetical protein [Aliiglaciecola]MBU2877984.1 hypothetical protein [Aliiglaciecola lipolytica]MDO6709349.1 hypothetical protein [Aliiglaciecola sp. 2_MG-2023]MDO6750497.1 hypothetical protein [Aliiglaciecola sp. 1_MG-2023]